MKIVNILNRLYLDSSATYILYIHEEQRSGCNNKNKL